MGERIAITSPVAQTTRRRMRAVVNRPGCQLVIVDTPGLHKPKDALGKELNRSALGELADVDVVAFLVDATKPVGRGDEWVATHVDAARAARLLVVTKADLATPEQVKEQLAAARKLARFADELVVSAKSGFNVDSFVSLVASKLPEGPQWFPEDMDTDQSLEVMVAEFIREKILRSFRDEIPHAIGVQTEEMTYSRKKDLHNIRAIIYVEHDSQKGMIIGKKGAALKKVGTEARLDMEDFFQKKVFLSTYVKVDPDWRENRKELRRFGYEF
jgi:GTP-binding protein Era